MVICPSKTKFVRSFPDLVGHPASLGIPFTMCMKVLQQLMSFSDRQDTSGHQEQSFICTNVKLPTHTLYENGLLLNFVNEPLPSFLLSAMLPGIITSASSSAVGLSINPRLVSTNSFKRESLYISMTVRAPGK